MEILAFTKSNPKNKIRNLPEEDSFKHYLNDKILISVADGITRDPLGVKILEDNLFNKIGTCATYLRPSPAKKASNLFCKSFIEYLKKKKIGDNSIKKSFEYINKKIYELNKGIKIDYLKNDFGACVGVGVIIKNNRLYYGYITDCGLAVFDRKGKLRFKTKNEGPNSKGDINRDVMKKYNTNFKYPKGRKIIRSKYRNNPSEPLAYGALTGEKNALCYVRTGEFQLTDKDYVILYSDGMFPIIFSKTFNISKNFDNLEKYINIKTNKISGHEGTLIALQI